MYKEFINKNLLRKSILFYTLFYIFVGVIFYNFMPWLLNYPIETVGTKFQLELEGTTYIVQYLAILITSYLATIFLMSLEYRNVTKDLKNEDEIKQRLVKYPLKVYKLQTIIPIVSIAFIHIISIQRIEITTIKLIGVLGSMIVFVGVVMYLFNKSAVSKILTTISNGKEVYNERLSFLKRNMIELLPVFVTLLLLLTMVAYSINVKDRQQLLNEVYNEKFKSIQINKNREEVKDYFKNMIKNNEKDIFFVYDITMKDIIYSDVKEFAISDYFEKYMLELSHKNSGMVYDYYGINRQGYVKKVSLENNEYYIGVYYNVYTQEVIVYLIFAYSFVLIIYLITLIYYALNVKRNLDYLTKRFMNISNHSKDILEFNRISIISNDEFGELSLEYNKVNEKTLEYITDLKNKQDVIVKQGQLVSIGELAGGVAHDINTPISAIKTAIQLLQELYQPRDETEKDILFRMSNCTEKIIKIVNSMRNQIRNLGSDQKYNFKVSDVIEDIRIVSYNEFQKNGSKLIVNIEDDLYILGDPTKLGQVFTNLFVNAVQAYGENGGKIEVSVSKAPNNKVMIKVRDYAGGIPEKIRDFVFKNILTTKGTKGTGLGLYLAYSVIKGEFSGDITFESTTGEGTTFYIILNRADESNEKVEEDNKE